MPQKARSHEQRLRERLPKVPETRPNSAARGYDRRWREIRRQVLAREPLCRECARRGRVEAATDVDHIVPLRAGGTHEAGNLQALCASCHARKTGRGG